MSRPRRAIRKGSRIYTGENSVSNVGTPQTLKVTSVNENQFCRIQDVGNYDFLKLNFKIGKNKLTSPVVFFSSRLHRRTVQRVGKVNE